MILLTFRGNCIPTGFYKKIMHLALQLSEEDEVPKYLERIDLKRFLRTAKKRGLDQDFPIFILLAYTGMRVGELCCLKWSDIDFSEHTLSITKTYYNPSNNTKKYKLQTPKTKAGIRKIDTDPDVIRVLEKHKLFQGKVRFRLGGNYYDKDYIFTNIKNRPGYPFYIKKIQNRMKRILRLADLPTELTPHSFRHTHTSLLAQAEVSLELIMERLGHDDEGTTRKIYLHATREMKKEASIKFQKLMEDL